MTDFDHSKLKSKASAASGWNFIVLMSRQGKIRLSEFFSSYTEVEKRRILRDIAADVLPRQAKMCNIIEKGEYKFVYRRYASLYFVVGAPVEMNELIVLEQIHLFVEALDGYFNSGEWGVGAAEVVYCYQPRSNMPISCSAKSFDPVFVPCVQQLLFLASCRSVRARPCVLPAQIPNDSV